MIVEELHIPEWDFQDEIRLIARQSLKSRSGEAQSPNNEASDLHTSNPHVPDDEVDENEGLLPDDSVQALAAVAGSYLERILAALVACTPSAEKRSSNRFEAIGWETVLRVVGAAGLVDER